MVSDIIIIAVIGLFVIIGVHRGLARTLLNLAGMALNVIATYYLSGFIADRVYNSFIKQSVIENLESIIKENGVSYAAANSLEAVPKWVNSLISAVAGIFGSGIDDIQCSLYVTERQSQTIAQTIEQPVGKVVISVFSAVLAVLIFILLFFLIKRLIKLILKFFNIPLIKQVNKILGGILGAVEGIVFVWLAINLFYVIMTYANTSLIENQFYFGKLFNIMCFFN